ncbi:hypothetical protein JCM10207_006201 [Rhodosporidiobolus poonsookiae]
MTQLHPPRSPVPPAVKADAGDRLDSAISLAQELFELPTVTSGKFLNGDGHNKDTTTLLLSASTRSLSGLNKRNATQSLLLSNADSSVLFSSPTVAVSEEVKHVSISPDGKRQALFRVIPAKEGKEHRRVIEIVEVEGGRKETEIEVTKDSGDWFFDGTFGPPAWHSSSLALAYPAEAPPPKPDPKATRPAQAKFHYEPDFGETFTGKREPTLFLVVLPGSPFAPAGEEDKPTVHRLTYPDTVPSAYFGQPVFLPSSDKLALVATGYSTLSDGRKLGIVYCQNRPARLFALTLHAVKQDVDEEAEDESPKTVYKVEHATPLSPADRSSRSPRVVPSSSPSSPQVVYLSNPLGGPHASCGQLHLSTLYLSSPSTLEVKIDQVLVPVVDVPDAKNPGAGTAADPFPGLYVDQLPLEPFVASLEGDGFAVVMSSIWRSRSVPLRVELAGGKVTSLAPWPERRDEEDAALPYLYLNKAGGEAKPDALESYTVLGTDGKDQVVALRSSPVKAPSVVVAKMREAQVEWKVVKTASLSEKLSATLSKLTYTILPLPKFSPTELIVVSGGAIDPTAPSTPNLPPLITIPHGGPHSTTTSSWNYSVAALVLAGYRVVHVNYPGSLGFGQAAVDVLPPQLGTLEVEATLAAPHYLNSLSLASRSPGKRLLMGGSHGGWTACHLTARWPDEFDAVVMRNPVTDLVANATQTDIPDWCFAEGTLPYPFTAPPSFVTPSSFAQMHSISPIRHASAVKTPTLLLIGADDRRVPPDQGRAWFHALRQTGAEVEMLKFPGNGHPIAETVEAEWVAWEAGARWLARFTDFS